MTDFRVVGQTINQLQHLLTSMEFLQTGCKPLGVPFQIRATMGRYYICATARWLHIAYCADLRVSVKTSPLLSKGADTSFLQGHNESVDQADSRGGLSRGLHREGSISRRAWPWGRVSAWRLLLATIVPRSFPINGRSSAKWSSVC